MIDSIQIVNKNGDGMITEGIAYIQIPSTGKKYLFYTLNEKVDNDLTKIYITETTDQVGGAESISDAEWEDLRKKMVKISHKEEVEDVVFLAVTNTNFNVGDSKKLAITAVAKQAFKDAQITHTMSTNQTDTPVTNGSPAFFNQSVVEPQNAEPQQEAVATPSIFEQPQQPIIETPTTPVVEPVVEPVVQPTVETVVTPVEQAPVTEQVTQVPTEPVQPVEVAQAVEPAPVVEQVSPVAEQPVATVEENNIQPQPDVAPVDAQPAAPEVNAPVEPVAEQPAPVETTPVVETIASAEVEAPVETVPVVEQPAIPASPVEAIAEPIETNTTGLEPIQAVMTTEEEITNPEEKIEESSDTETSTEETVSPVMQMQEIAVPGEDKTKKIISDEEALEAINTIQEYLKQENQDTEN